MACTKTNIIKSQMSRLEDQNCEKVHFLSGDKNLKFSAKIEQVTESRRFFRTFSTSGNSSKNPVGEHKRIYIVRVTV